MKKFLLILTAVLVGLITANAETSSYTFTKTPTYTNKSFTVTATDNAVWTFTCEGDNYLGFDNQSTKKGAQFGKNDVAATPLTATTADIKGTISSIKINTSRSAKGGTRTVSVKVGGQSFTYNESSSVTLSTTATDYTFTGSASGEIEISWACSTNAGGIYVKSIEVTYQPATVPEVNPSTPVVTFGETICVNDEVYEVPYLTEVTVTSENAQSIKVGDVEYPGSSCKFAVKVSDIYTIQGVNTTGVSEEVNVGFETTAIDPVLSFDPAEVKLYFGDEFTAPTLTAPEELTTFTYASSNTEVAEVDNTGKVTIKAIGQTTITVKSAAIADKYNEGTASYTINVLDPETRPIKSEFNFATNSPYGMYNYSGSDTDYEGGRTDGKEPVTSITDGKVTLTFSGNYRAWNSSDLRLSGTTPGQIVITLSDPAYEIESVSYVGSSIKLSQASFTPEEWGKEVIVSNSTINNSKPSTAKLTSLTVTLRKLPEMNSAPTYDQQGTVITFSCTDPAYMLQYRIYTPEWDKEQPAQCPARAMAEQDWTDNEAGLGQDFKHEVPENEGKYVIEVRQYHKGLVSPTSSFYVAEDGNVSGIEDVVIENAPAVYYNLQGVRVEGDLTPGLYIRRQGNTTTKVIVR